MVVERTLFLASLVLAIFLSVDILERSLLICAHSRELNPVQVQWTTCAVACLEG